MAELCLLKEAKVFGAKTWIITDRGIVVQDGSTILYEDIVKFNEKRGVAASIIYEITTTDKTVYSIEYLLSTNKVMPNLSLYIRSQINTEEAAVLREEIEEAKKEQLEKEKERLIKEQEIEKERLIKEAEKMKVVTRLNPLYEYNTVTVGDVGGGASAEKLNEVIALYSKKRWRLCCVTTNEVGRRSQSTGVGSVSTGTNSTIDQTVLIFERCIEDRVVE